MKTGTVITSVLIALVVSIVSMLVACKPQNPLPKQATGATLKVTRFLWTDSQELPQTIREENEQRGRFGLMGQVSVENSKAFSEFLEQADARVLMEAEEKHPTLKINFDAGCWWFQDGAAWIYLPFGPADRRDLKSSISYRVRPQNHAADKFLGDFDQNVMR
ncbi:MAG TPA: hypothetical protein VNT99_16975 [Methylomirabilota bacterium]|nr:hypothetical protein [Methylomirabilota bacterium]